MRRKKQARPKNINSLSPQALIEKLTFKALRFLSYRPRSQKEIEDYLSRSLRLLEDQHLKTSSINQIINKLKQNQLIDDQDFARWWIDQRDQHKPRSAWLLQRELRNKGISNQILANLIDQSRETEFKRAQQSLKLKHKNLNPNNLRHRKKLHQFLRYRGFSWPTINQVIDWLKERS